MSLQISVIGSGEATPETVRLAEEVGRELGKRGVTVVTGGLAGVMEAASFNDAELSLNCTVPVVIRPMMLGFIVSSPVGVIAWRPAP